MGVSAASVLALLFVFNMLLNAKEANGVLIQGIETAQGVNDRQKATLAEVQSNHDNLLVQIDQERVRTKEATDALEASEAGLDVAEANFNQRLKAAVAGMSDEDLECASEFVPAALIDSLHDETSGID